MQIIIPMSGFGERFRRAGYHLPKPLIEVEGKPVIAHVVDMFPGETDFIFICSQVHLDNPEYRMREILQSICATGKIIGIPAHKLGPVHAVLLAEKEIDLYKPSIVNYCDFTCYWDWNAFKKFTLDSKCDGAIPAYKGFHPHSLGTTNYAYMQEENGWVTDIQEKQPYTNNRMNEYASSGTYYYASGELMVDAYKKTVALNLNTNGEFYASLSYKPLLKSGKKIAVYPIDYFMQWGTPEDLAEYNMWSHAFKLLHTPPAKAQTKNGTIIIPMAGLGKRFSDEGYTQTKPLIPVSGKPMVIQATEHLPAAKHLVFVLRADMPGLNDISEIIKKQYGNAELVTIPTLTEGQACTAMLGLEKLLSNHTADIDPLTIGACDNGTIYNDNRFQELLKDENVDVIVWGFRGNANAARHPKMFGWIDEKEGVITNISVKTPLSNPKHDAIVIGTFTFKRHSHFINCVNHLIDRNGRINGEFYIDSCINDAIELGLKCHLFEVDSYLSWGTPNDLQTFEYWESCFSLWEGHSNFRKTKTEIT